MSVLLAYLPFLHAWPAAFSGRAQLLMFLPLALCIALVYRATRARRAADLPRGVVITFFNIVIGMAAIAIGMHLVYEFVIRVL